MAEKYTPPENMTTEVVAKTLENIREASQKQGRPKETIDEVLKREFPEIQKVIEDNQLSKPLTAEDVAELSNVLHKEYSSTNMRIYALLMWVTSFKNSNASASEQSPGGEKAEIIKIANFSQRRRKQK